MGRFAFGQGERDDDSYSTEESSRKPRRGGIGRFRLPRVLWKQVRQVIDSAPRWPDEDESEEQKETEKAKNGRK